MALIYFERILDLGDFGLLTLTLDMTVYLPLPATPYGHACWHAPDGSAHDRLVLCTRAPGLAALQSAATQQSARFASAVESVKGRVKWVAAQIDEAFREAPTAAEALDGGRVLLLFCGVVGPKIVRIIDVPAGVVVAEEPVDALAQRLGAQLMYGQASFDATLVGSGGPWWAMWLGRAMEMLTLRDGRIERAATGLLPKADRMALAQKAWFIRDYDPPALRIVDSADTTAPARPVTSPFLRAESTDLAAAGSTGQCVLAHPGGIIEVIDAEGRSQAALRPFPAMARKDTAGLGNVSNSGRYVLCSDAGSETVIVDLRQSLQTGWPTSWDLGDDHRMSFVPEVSYRGAEIVTDRGIARLERGELRFDPLDALDWRPTLPAAARRPRKPSRKADETAWLALRRPALSLVPDKCGSPGCQMYGYPHLAEATDWPRFVGRPMLLLCQVDLACAPAPEALAPLPASGALLFFVAADELGEPLLDETFNPAAAKVLYVPRLAPRARDPLAELSQAPAAQPLIMVADAAQWPQLDAPNVGNLSWSPSQLDAYRHFLDSLLPEGPSPGHRLGGYPTVLQHNDLEFDAARVWPDSDPLAWRLLLQLDSDDVFMWGTDSGMLYFLIEDSALAARDFSRVVALTQGY